MFDPEIHDNLSTCLSTLRSDDSEDKQQLTASNDVCESDPDYPDDDYDADDYERQSFLQRFVHSNHCTICMYLSTSLVILGSVVALIVIIVKVVLPYTTVDDFCSTTCFPRKVNVELGQTCLCGTGCTARYRCLMIQVIYHDHAKIWKNATLYEDESTLGRKCSFYPQCQGSPSHVQQAVDVYERHYAVVGLPFNCWFNPSDYKQAIRTKRFHLYHVVNGILWTTIILLMSLVGLLCILKKRGCVVYH